MKSFRRHLPTTPEPSFAVPGPRDAWTIERGPKGPSPEAVAISRPGVLGSRTGSPSLDRHIPAASRGARQATLIETPNGLLIVSVSQKWLSFPIDQRPLICRLFETSETHARGPGPAGQSPTPPAAVKFGSCETPSRYGSAHLRRSLALRPPELPYAMY